MSEEKQHEIEAIERPLQAVVRPRRYGQWAGDPDGRVEDLTRCAYEVFSNERGALHHQCYRRRGHGEDGEYCKQHAKWHPAKEV